MTSKQKTFLIVIGILCLSIFARTWQITKIPGGLFPDQAANGEDAISILHGKFQPFYEGNNGREGLFFYIQAVCLAIFGINVWPMFLASAIVGVFTVLFTYFAGKRMFGNKVALLSAFFMATNQWHVTLSRDGFRAIMSPLFIALTFFFFVGIFKSNTTKTRLLNSIFAGISFGLGWYTYIAYRAFLGVIIVGFLLLLIQGLTKKPRQLQIKKYYKSFALFFIFSVITLIPLGVFFLDHPEFVSSRSSQVSILNRDLNKGNLIGTAGNVISDSLLSFITHGDKNPRHNVSGFPFLSPFPALLFLVGLVVCVVRTFKYFHELFKAKKPEKYFISFMMIILFVVMLLPEIATAEGIPHGLRSVGEIPGIFWVTGIGGAWVINKIYKLNYLSMKKVAWLIFFLFCLLTPIYDIYLYFGISARSADFASAYRSDLTSVSERLINRASKGLPKAYVVIDGFSEMTTHFLTTKQDYPYIKLTNDEALNLDLENNEELIYTLNSISNSSDFEKKHPEFVKEVIKDRFNEPIMVIFRK